jgi:hypothetical protein
MSEILNQRVSKLTAEAQITAIAKAVAGVCEATILIDRDPTSRGYVALRDRHLTNLRQALTALLVAVGSLE